MAALLDIHESVVPVSVTLPDGRHATSTHEGTLNWPTVPLAARRGHIFPDFTDSLLSIGKLCDQDLTATFNKTAVTIHDGTTTFLTGPRDAVTGMWRLPISMDTALAPPTINATAAAVPLSTMKPAIDAFASYQRASPLADFYHACMGSPVPSTLFQALTHTFIEFPGINMASTARRNPFRATIATAKGHLTQCRQGIASTKEFEALDESSNEWYPIAHPRGVQQPGVQAILIREVITDIPTGRLHVDATGRFPITSDTSKAYHLVFFAEDANYIHVETIGSRESGDYLAAYQRATEFFRQHGIVVRYIRIDNEISTTMSNFCLKQDPIITIEKVVPGNHRANGAERAIRTWKDHFIATLATAPRDFPMQIWDLLVPFAEMTLNLMRGTGQTATISAWQQLHGPFSYNATPFAPPGTQVLCFESSGKRSSWAPHGKLGYYLGPSMTGHYRCHRIWISETRDVRVTDTVQWLPTLLYSQLLTATSTSTQSAADPSSSLGARATGEPEDVVQQSDPLAGIKGVPSMGTEPDKHSEDIQQELTAPTCAPAADRRVTFFSNETSNSGDSPTIKGVANTPIPRDSISAVPESGRKQGASTSPDDTATEWEPPIVPDRMPEPKELRRGMQPSAEERLFPVGERRRGARSRKLNQRLIAACGVHYHNLGEANAASMQDAFRLNDNNRAMRFADTKKAWDHAEWDQATVDEFLRLLVATQTMRFIDPAAKPQDRLASYFNPQVSTKVKEGIVVRRVRGTYGGDRSDFEGAKSAATADMTTVKLLLNAVVSEPDAKLMVIDVKDFYLGTDLDRPEYMWIARAQIPETIGNMFASTIVWVNDRAMVEIVKGIYGLPQAGRLAQLKLKALLKRHGYNEAKHTPCLFTHVTRSVKFSLVVDDFAVLYKQTADAQHLMDCLREEYEITADWEACKYLGMTINFGAHQGHRIVTLTMPGYVQSGIIRFGKDISDKPLDAPGIYAPPVYGQPVQMAPPVDDSPFLDAAGVKYIQEVLGYFLYYARAVDATMLMTLNRLASQQAAPTQQVLADVHHFLQYARTHPDGSTVFHASTMQLVVHSDASFFCESRARSRAGGFSYLRRSDNADLPNGGVDILSSIIKVVVSSVAEAEYAALFFNGRTAAAIRNSLDDLGFPQGVTDIIGDNTTACGIANRTTRQKQSKAMDVAFYWITDRVDQGMFRVIWRPGPENLADY